MQIVCGLVPSLGDIIFILTFLLQVSGGGSTDEDREESSRKTYLWATRLLISHTSRGTQFWL